MSSALSNSNRTETVLETLTRIRFQLQLVEAHVRPNEPCCADWIADLADEVRDVAQRIDGGRLDLSERCQR